MKKEQKDFNKVEPKFKVGDWVAINPELRFASPLCIRDNDNNNYRVESVDGNSGTPTIDYLNNHYHLWDITKDAKYGDVLADDYGIYIFDRFDEYDKRCFLCVGAYQYSQKVYEDERMLCSIDVRPATKEQRDQLEKAMTNAGYTFDFDKKELKKIEQKRAWSEEDYNEIETIACHLDNIDNGGMAEVLRSIRDKYCHIIPQPTWKPSDEQMKALNAINVTGVISYAEQGQELINLYNELKKLWRNKL